MCGGAESEKSDALARFDAGYSETAETDDAGAQKRRGVQIVKGGGKRVDEIRAGERVIGIASVDRVSGEGGGVA